LVVAIKGTCARAIAVVVLRIPKDHGLESRINQGSMWALAVIPISIPKQICFSASIFVEVLWAVASLKLDTEDWIGLPFVLYV